MTGIDRYAPGRMMSQAVAYNGVLYLAGCIAWQSRSEDAAAQTRDILGQIDDILQANGSDKSRLLSASIWLADISDFDAMNRVWQSWIDSANPPARATVEAKLAFPDLKVEIQVIAALPAAPGQ